MAVEEVAAKKRGVEIDLTDADADAGTNGICVSVSFSESLVSVFEEGLRCDIWSYRQGYDRLVHLSFEANRHEVDSNKFAPHSVAARLQRDCLNPKPETRDDTRARVEAPGT